MYTIGQFSRICKLSSRMLRHYDQEGLLKPNYVDPLTNYRYYTSDQLEVALFIRELRKYRFSLVDIKIIVETSDRNVLHSMMEEKIKELTNELDHSLQLVEDMKHVIKSEYSLRQGNKKNYDILSGIRHESSFLGQRVQLKVDEIDHLLEGIYERADEQNIHLVGVPSVVFWNEALSGEEIDVEWRIACDTQLDEEVLFDWKNTIVPESLIVSTIHLGSYDEIGYAYLAIENWIKENNYQRIGPPYETYLRGAECEEREANYLTKVTFPIS